jgi:hypothetical protein
MKPLSEDQVELIVAAILGVLFGILTGYSLEKWMVRHNYLGTHRRYCLRAFR